MNNRLGRTLIPPWLMTTRMIMVRARMFATMIRITIFGFQFHESSLQGTAYNVSEFADLQ